MSRYDTLNTLFYRKNVFALSDRDSALFVLRRMRAHQLAALSRNLEQREAGNQSIRETIARIRADMERDQQEAQP